MKIAVSISDDEKICPHLGKAKSFCIFIKENNSIKFVEIRSTKGNYQNHIIDDIEDCQVVISGQIGEGMIKSLALKGIKAIVENETQNVLEAVNKV